MAHLMPNAFVAASLADIRALLADGLRIFAAAGHAASRQPAYLGTVHVQRDAGSHHFHVLLLQAGRRALVASVGTGITSFDT